MNDTARQKCCTRNICVLLQNVLSIFILLSVHSNVRPRLRILVIYPIYGILWCCFNKTSSPRFSLHIRFSLVLLGLKADHSTSHNIGILFSCNWPSFLKIAFYLAEVFVLCWQICDPFYIHVWLYYSHWLINFFSYLVKVYALLFF